LVLSSLLMVLGSARIASAEMTFNPATMMRTSELRVGMKGYCKTVLEGTKIEKFGVEVLGVLENQWYGGDIIFFRITDGPLVDKQMGIISGMSGSPVYVDDKLVGAISLSFSSFMKEPLGGATPIEQMLEARPTTTPAAEGPVALSEPLTVGGKTFRRVEVCANWGDVDERKKDTIVLRPVATPLMVSGVNPERLPEWDKWLRPYGFRVVPGGGSMPDGPEVELEAGSSLGIEIATGDITIFGGGTVTYREGNEFLAFGHPMDQMGSTALPIGTAYVNGVIASEMDPFKMMSPIRTVGTLSQDRPWAVAGIIGPIPPRIPITLHARNTSKGLERNFKVQVTKELDYTLWTLTAVCQEGLLSLADSFGDQSATIKTRVKPEGMDAIEVSDFLSFSETGGGWWGMPVWAGASDSLNVIVNMLQTNPYKQVGVEEVSLDVEMVDRSQEAEIEKVQLDRLNYRPGDEVTLHVTVLPWQGERQYKDISFTVPENIVSGQLEVEVAGGGGGNYSYYAEGSGLLQPTYDDLPGMIAAWLENHKEGNELQATVSYEAYGLSSPKGLLHNVPSHVTNLLYLTGKVEATPGREWERNSVATGWYISGEQHLTITVEKERWAPPQPSGGPGAYPGGPPPGGAYPEEYYGPYGAIQGPSPGYSVPRWDGTGMLRSTWESRGVSPGTPQWLSGPLSQPSSPNVSGLATAVPSPGKAPPPAVMEQMQAQMEKAKAQMEKEAGAAGEGEQEKEEEKPEEGELVGRRPSLAGWINASDFSSFKFEGAYPTEDGRIVGMPAISKIAEIPEGTAWSVVADPAGNIYVGTGPAGRIYEFTAAGEQVRVVETGQLMVNALATSPQGVVFAGTSPGAEIFSISEAGEAKLFCDLPDEHVWALRFDKEGNLLAAVGGEQGRLYSISPQGKASLVYQPEDSRHVICLDLDDEGQAYLGTAEPGKVIVLDKERNPRDSYEVATQEVVAVAKWKSSIVFSTPDPALYRITDTGTIEPLGTTTEEGSPHAKPPEGAAPPEGPPVPFVTGFVAVPGGLLVASADSSGGVWLLTGEKQLTQLVSLYGSQVTHAFGAADGKVYLSGNNPVALYATEGKEGSIGTATSPPYDTGRLSRWGRAFWRAELPAGSEVRVMSRTGNTPSPDTTWSEWSFSRTRPSGYTIENPPARFIQFKVELVAGYDNAAPALEELLFVFLPANREPTLTISEPGAVVFWSGQKTISWEGSDPDNDKLTYSLFISSDDGKTWEELKKDLTDQSYDWDTKEKKDGIYLLKAVVTDGRANPDNPKEVEKVSNTVYVDNTPPLILLKRSKGTLTAGTYTHEGVATDLQTSITAVEYRLDEGDWQAAVAVDGIFDSKREKFKFEIKDMASGSHKLEVAAVDQARNRKSTTSDIEGPEEAAPSEEVGKEGKAEEAIEGETAPELQEQMEGEPREGAAPVNVPSGAMPAPVGTAPNGSSD